LSSVFKLMFSICAVLPTVKHRFEATTLNLGFFFVMQLCVFWPHLLCNVTQGVDVVLTT